MDHEPEIHITIDNRDSANRIGPVVSHDPVDNDYGKFIQIIVGITIFSIGFTFIRGWSIRQLLDDFMAAFFIVFASFKLLNIEDFVITYRTYDKIAQRFRPWAYIFPFVEATLGFAYMFVYDSATLNIVTMIITGSAGYSVWRTLQDNKHSGRKFHCACLGKVIKLPLSTVSLIEDWLMFAMAGIMLFL